MRLEGELRAYPAVPPSHRSPRSLSSRLRSVTVATQLFSMGPCSPVFFKAVGSIGPIDIPTVPSATTRPRVVVPGEINLSTQVTTDTTVA